MSEHGHENERELYEAPDDAREGGEGREVMQGEHGRGQRTAGDRELLEPERAPEAETEKET